MLRRGSDFYSLGPLEREVMEVIWGAGKGLPVREILKVINAHKSVPYAYTTILTVCQNLEKKGLLKSERVGRMNLYHPTVGREKFYKDRLTNIIGQFVKEHPEVAVSFFAEAMDLTPEEAYELLKKFEK